MASSAITAELMLEIKGFLDGVKKAQTGANKFAKDSTKSTGGWSTALKGIGKALAAVGVAASAAAAVVGALGLAVAAGLAKGLKSAFDLGGQYSDLAARMGTTAGQARILAAAFEANGMGAEDTATTIDKMQKTIYGAANGMGAAADAFSAIGLDADALMQGDPVTAFNEVMGALAAVSNETERTALSMEIFGRAGGRLGVMMNDPKALENARRLIGGQAAILDEHAGAFDHASDTLNQVGGKIQGFFLGVGAKIIEQIMPAVEALIDLDLTGIGLRFGAALSTALNYAVAIFQVFKSMNLAQIATLFGALLMVGFGEAVNFLYRGLVASFAGVVTYFVEAVKNVLAFMSILSTKAFWSGMLNALMGIAQLFGGFIAKAIGDLLTTLKRIPGASRVIGDADEFMRNMGEDITSAGKENLAQGGADLKPAMDVMTGRMKEAATNIGAAVADTFKKTGGVVDTSESKATIAGVTSEIAATAAALEKDKKKEEKAPDAPMAAAVSDDGLPKLNSRLAGAINTISGRSANAIIASEAAKTSVNTERTAKAAEEIAKNTANNGTGSTPTPKPVPAGGAFV
jgi:hypothetical protein